MITIKGRFATYGEVWFDEDPPAAPAVDVLTFRGRCAPLGDEAWSPFSSLVHDLTVDPEKLFATFDSTARYEVRRAQSRDRLSTEFFTDPGAALDGFCAFYDVFARHKGLPPSYRRALRATCDAGRLVLTSASRDGSPLVWHAYVTDGRTAALLHSASHFRAASAANRALLGRANRWLHWRDMLGFKDMGVATYDWGGLFDDESVPEQASVNRFKRRFGGRPHRAYTAVAMLTVKGRAYRAVRSMVECVSNARRVVRNACANGARSALRLTS
ncbi:MAG TPA: hypothetical protein VHP37_24720 [Burkholderiales bacterium]|nr:hypothetical protein [Burkholderiales bacterium]